MITVVVVGPSFQEAEEQISIGNEKGECLEFRLDRFDFKEYDKIKELRQLASIPVIFTNRKVSQGGNFIGDEPERLMRVQQLASLKPDYIDLEYDVEESFFEEIKSLVPDVKIICSYHNFDETPRDLQNTLTTIHNPYATHYKVVTMAQSTLDSLRMLKFLKQNQAVGLPVIGLCMGEVGELTRILAPVYGSLMTYSSVDNDHACAPGQLDVDTLENVYHFNDLNPQTKVLGLIGNPVSQSPSHITHNKVIRELGLDAVYVKMCVTPQEVDEFLRLSQELGFLGTSVTIPLKEEVLRSISEYYPGSMEIGAINTLHFTENGIHGRNTDCSGALDAIEEKLSVEGKTVVIIGAGGAAKAVAYEAKKRGAKVYIINRTPEKAELLANILGCQWGSFSEYSRIAEEGYDVIINATAVGLNDTQGNLPFAKDLLPETLAMDVVYHPMDTPFLLSAQDKGCTIVYGIEMFVHQAVKQFEFWLGDSVDTVRIKDTLEEALSQKLYSKKDSKS